MEYWPSKSLAPWLEFENEAHLGHISSSEAGFVQCFERREQFLRRSLFFVATYRKGLISVGGHKINRDLQNKFPTFPGFFAPIACLPQK